MSQYEWSGEHPLLLLGCCKVPALARAGECLRQRALLRRSSPQAPSQYLWDLQKRSGQIVARLKISFITGPARKSTAVSRCARRCAINLTVHAAHIQDFNLRSAPKREMPVLSKKGRDMKRSLLQIITHLKHTIMILIKTCICDFAAKCHRECDTAIQKGRNGCDSKKTGFIHLSQASVNLCCSCACLPSGI